MILVPALFPTNVLLFYNIYHTSSAVWTSWYNGTFDSASIFDRDNIHSFDVANFIYLFSKDPKISAVYNIGGGYNNSISILESIKKIEEISEQKMIS